MIIVVIEMFVIRMAKMKRFRCCICNEVYWGNGHNAKPFRDGRCCDDCNIKYVIAYRNDLIKLEILKKEEKNGR